MNNLSASSAITNLFCAFSDSYTFTKGGALKQCLRFFLAFEDESAHSCVVTKGILD